MVCTAQKEAQARTHENFIFAILCRRQNFLGDISGEEKQTRDYGRNTEFMQTAADQNESFVYDKPIVENASGVCL